MIFPIHAFLSRHSFSVGGSFIRTADQARGKLGLIPTSYFRALARRCPANDTEGSQHDFHCERAKDESHYTDEDGRALPTDHPQNRIRKKQEDVGNEEHHQKDNAGFDPLRHRINIVIS